MDSLSFLKVIKIKSGVYNNTKMDGILGLAPYTADTIDKAKYNFMANLIENNLITHNIFSIYTQFKADPKKKTHI